MRLTLLAAALLVVFLAASAALVINKKESAARKKERPPLRFEVKDFPERGILLIPPSDPAFARMEAALAPPEPAAMADSYSVFLKNDAGRAVVGYRIKWECVDGGGEVSAKDVSNVVSWIFLHGEEAARGAALGRSNEVIRPGTVWLISFGSSARPLEGSGDERAAGATRAEAGGAETTAGCVGVTVIADGIFFDDGTFIGPDTTGFFTEVKSQMDARYEILRGVQNDLEAGKKPGEIFASLEKIRDRESVNLGERPTPDEFRTYFRNLFARDVLGRKQLWGADKALEDVRLTLSRPWVRLRKL